MKFKMWNGCDRGLCCKAVGRQDRQLNTYDWLATCQETLRAPTWWKCNLKIPERDIITMLTTSTSRRATSWL